MAKRAKIKKAKIQDVFLNKFREFPKEKKLREEMFGYNMFKEYQTLKRLLLSCNEEKQSLFKIVDEIKKQRDMWMVKYHKLKNKKLSWLGKLLLLKQ